MVSLAIVPFWFENIDGANAALHQLRLYQKLVNLRPHATVLVDAVVDRLQDHLWYVSEEITPLALASPLMSDEDRAELAEVGL